MQDELLKKQRRMKNLILVENIVKIILILLVMLQLGKFLWDTISTFYFGIFVAGIVFIAVFYIEIQVKRYLENQILCKIQEIESERISNDKKSDVWKKLVTGVYNQKTTVVAVAAYFGNGVLSIYSHVYNTVLPSETFIFFTVGIGLFLVIGIIGLIFLRAGEYKNEITIRKYGETWVRHEATIFQMQSAMYKYVMGLEPYNDSIDERMKKKLFMEEILEVMSNNESTFQNNMKTIV